MKEALVKYVKYDDGPAEFISNEKTSWRKGFLYFAPFRLL